MSQVSDAFAAASAQQYLSLLLANYPLSFVFAKLPSPTLKHVYSLVVGLWMMQVG